MALIEAQDNGGFRKYLKQTRNTICGRHPINVCGVRCGSRHHE